MRTWRAVFERSTTFARRSTGPSPRSGTRRSASISPSLMRRSGNICLLMTECRERCERALLSLEPHVTANTRPRMQLQIALAGAMITTMGAAEQAKTVLTEALETADTLNDIDAQARALTVLRTLYIIYRGEYGPGADRGGTARRNRRSYRRPRKPSCRLIG